MAESSRRVDSDAAKASGNKAAQKVTVPVPDVLGGRSAPSSSSLPTTRDRLEEKFRSSAENPAGGWTARARLLQSHGAASAPPTTRARLASNLIQAKLNSGNSASPEGNAVQFQAGEDQQLQLEQAGPSARDSRAGRVGRAGGAAPAENPNHSGSGVHGIAEAGLRGHAGRLPYLDTIQRSFGRHDVSDVKSHMGGPATSANRALGAQAFTSGDRVAFAGAPSLHTAAHEAAHVVQQRGGIQLKGGVGQAGDAHEKHADSVADAVVRGKSAESLLNPVGPKSSAPAVQRKAVQFEPAPQGASEVEELTPEDTLGGKKDKKAGGGVGGGAGKAGGSTNTGKGNPSQNPTPPSGEEKKKADEAKKALDQQSAGVAGSEGKGGKGPAKTGGDQLADKAGAKEDTTKASPVEQGAKGADKTGADAAKGGGAKSSAADTTKSPTESGGGGDTTKDAIKGGAKEQGAGGGAGKDTTKAGADTTTGGGGGAKSSAADATKSPTEKAGGGGGDTTKDATKEQGAGGGAGKDTTKGVGVSPPGVTAPGGGTGGAGGGDNKEAAKDTGGAGPTSEEKGPKEAKGDAKDAKGDGAKPPAAGGAGGGDNAQHAAAEPPGGGAEGGVAPELLGAAEGKPLIEEEVDWHEKWEAFKGGGIGARLKVVGMDTLKGIGDGAIGAAKGVAITQGIGLLSRAIPVPGLSNIIGGFMSFRAIQAGGGFKAVALKTFKGPYWEGGDIFEKLGNLIIKIRGILDFVGHIANIVSGVAYVVAGAATLLGFIFPPIWSIVPICLNVGKIAGGVATLTMGISEFLSFLPPILFLIHQLTSDNDPALLVESEKKYKDSVTEASTAYLNTVGNKAVETKVAPKVADMMGGGQGAKDLLGVPPKVEPMTFNPFKVAVGNLTSAAKGASEVKEGYHGAKESIGNMGSAEGRKDNIESIFGKGAGDLGSGTKDAGKKLEALKTYAAGGAELKEMKEERKEKQDESKENQPKAEEKGNKEKEQAKQQEEQAKQKADAAEHEATQAQAKVDEAKRAIAEGDAAQKTAEQKSQGVKDAEAALEAAKTNGKKPGSNAYEETVAARKSELEQAKAASQEANQALEAARYQKTLAQAALEQQGGIGTDSTKKNQALANAKSAQIDAEAKVKQAEIDAGRALRNAKRAQPRLDAAAEKSNEAVFKNREEMGTAGKGGELKDAFLAGGIGIPGTDIGIKGEAHKKADEEKEDKAKGGAAKEVNEKNEEKEKEKGGGEGGKKEDPYAGKDLPPPPGSIKEIDVMDEEIKERRKAALVEGGLAAQAAEVGSKASAQAKVLDHGEKGVKGAQDSHKEKEADHAAVAKQTGEIKQKQGDSAAKSDAKSGETMTGVGPLNSVAATLDDKLPSDSSSDKIKNLKKTVHDVRTGTDQLLGKGASPGADNAAGAKALGQRDKLQGEAKGEHDQTQASFKDLTSKFSSDKKKADGVIAEAKAKKQSSVESQKKWQSDADAMQDDRNKAWNMLISWAAGHREQREKMIADAKAKQTANA